MSIQLPMATLIGMAVDRFALLARPPSSRRAETPEPSPLAEGGTAAEWATLAALGEGLVPHELIREKFPHPVNMGSHDPQTVAAAALQRLAQRSIVERVGGLPLRYRPLVR